MDKLNNKIKDCCGNKQQFVFIRSFIANFLNGQKITVRI